MEPKKGKYYIKYPRRKFRNVSIKFWRYNKSNRFKKKKINQKRMFSSNHVNIIKNNKSNIKKRNKEVRIENHCSKLTNLSNNSTCFSNASINPMIEIPSATLNLFD